MASRPPIDLATYKHDITSILDKYNPLLLSVENEESNKEYYSGTAQQYGAELRAACQVAHAHGYTCTNGGIDSNMLVQLVWDSYIESGERGAACDIATRAASGLTRQDLAVQLCAARSIAQTPASVQATISEGNALLEVYTRAGADFVNIHWSIPDPQVLREAVTLSLNPIHYECVKRALLKVRIAKCCDSKLYGQYRNQGSALALHHRHQ